MNDSVDDKKSVQVFVERDRKVFLVWNAEDVKRLRTKHRFVGELVGTLPTHKSQNDYLGLPLQLSVEEVSVGCFYGIVVFRGFLNSFFSNHREVFWNW